MLKSIKNRLAYAAAMAPVLAQEKINLTPGNNSEFRDLANLKAPQLISTAISLIMVVVALVFFFMLLWGGLKWVTSEGEQKAVEAARNQITNALIGLAIVFAAWAIVSLVGAVFKIEILNLSIPTV